MPRLVYDGDCALCQRSVAWMQAHDRRGRLQAVPSQDLDLSPDLRARTDETVLWLDGDRTYDESAAAVRALWHLGGVSRLYAGLLWVVPKPLRDAGYRYVARNRHRSKGKGEGKGA